MVSVNFPVFVLAKDCGEVTAFNSADELRRALEPIDVDNDEFLAWDAVGTPLTLETRPQPLWLHLRTTEAPPEPARLREHLLQYARDRSVALDASSVAGLPLSEVLRQIEKAASSRLDSQRSPRWVPQWIQRWFARRTL